MAAASGRTLVFGGRGLVGTAVCRELARRGVSPVLSLGRSSGPGAGGRLAEGSGVEVRDGVDALRPETFAPLLPGAHTIVISIGEPPWILDKERAMRSNGLTNVSVLRAAAEHKVPRVVLINATMPRWKVISGYREGKETAEREALQYSETCGESGVLIVKPSAISGTRYSGSMPVPLWLMLEPMRLVFKALSGPCMALERMMPSLLEGVLRPPVRVEEIARAVADAIQDPKFKGVRVLGTDDLVGYKSRDSPQ
uniref:NAD-dependent epimerase/dehydratase domain-containing protein n=1 Tax=Alexandrium monilatum TaxID=311494 RepID=A0A7S4PT26_9DINO